MIIAWTEIAWESYLYWQINDKHMLKKINALIKGIIRDPFHSIGKPEPLKFELTGKWSRRINDEHRLIYKIDDGKLIIFDCRYHY